MADLKTTYRVDTSQLKRAERDLNQFIRSNRKGFDRVNAQMRTFGKTSDVAFNQFGRQASRAQVASKRFASVGLQQVGYQVGDFAVQLQGGTNAMVAFGQQGSQLLGIFGPMGAIAGAALAIFTAFAAPMLDGAKAAKEFGNELDKLQSKIEGVGSSMKMLESIGSVGGGLMGIDLDLLKIEAQRVREEITKATESAVESVDSVGYWEGIWKTAARNNWQAFARSTASAFTAGASNFLPRDWIPNIFPTPEETLKEMGFNANLVTAEFFDQFQQAISQGNIGELPDLMREFEEAINASSEGFDALTPKAENLVSQMRRLSLLAELNEQKTNRMNLAIELFKDRSAETVVEAIKLADELTEAELKALSLSGIDIKGGIDAAAKSALELAVQMGISLRAAMGIVELRNNKVYSGRGSGQAYGFGNAPGEFAPSQEIIDAAAKLLAPQTGTSGGGGGASSATDAMERSYAKLMDRLNGVNPLVTKHREEVAKLKEWLDKGAISQTEYNTALSKLKEELNKNLDPLKKFKDQLEETLDPNANHMKGLEALNNALADFIFDPFENGVKGMVLQFSDAMRRMASEAIAARIMQSFIKSPLGGAFGGIFANGAAFSGGRVTPFASGGVVNGPTVFPMANGMGLMGEAGPEAVMPLKRDKSGRLGVEAQGAQVEAPQIKVVNIDDRASIGEYLEGPAGEKVVMNVLRRNGIVNR